MLGKLMKYEWKAMWKVLVIINVFTVVMTIFGWIGLSSPVFHNMMSVDSDIGVAAVLLFVLYYLTIIGVCIAISVYIGIRFYKSMYTDEGYLMHTLPVTPRQHIISRLIVHSACYCITGVLVFISVMILMLPLASLVSDDSMTNAQILYEITSATEIAFGMSASSAIIYSLVITVVGAFSSIVMIYGAISIGQTFQKHKVMASILCYVGLYFAMQAVVSFLIIPQSISFTLGNFDMASYMSSVMLLSVISSAVSGIVFYIISVNLMKKKLNLD